MGASVAGIFVGGSNVFAWGPARSGNTPGVANGEKAEFSWKEKSLDMNFKRHSPDIAENEERENTIPSRVETCKLVKDGGGSCLVWNTVPRPLHTGLELPYRQM